MRNHHCAFTLIELLVVISIIAVLISILLPALSAARDAAKNIQCLSNIRQVATAMVTYETDERRLPVHLYEILPSLTNTPDQLSRNSGNPAHDLRRLYTHYMGSANFFSCPFLPEWDKDEDAIPAATTRLYVDYQLVPGYFCDFDGTNYDTTAFWKRSDDIWEYDGDRVNVLVAGRLTYLSPYTRFNHPLKSGIGANLQTPSGVNQATQYYIAGSDVFRQDAEANFAFRDGHAATYKGSDEKMVSITAPRFGANFEVMIPVE